MATTPNQIQHVRELIKSGKRAQALTQLARLIERDHNNVELWWLLANATDDVHQARRALEEVLSLEPANERARKMLERLETRQLLNQMGVTNKPETRRTPMVLPLVLVFVVISGVLVVMAVIVSNQQQQPEEIAELPTSITLPSETPTLPPTDVIEPTVVILPENTSEIEAADVTAVTDEVVTDDPFAPTTELDGVATEVSLPTATETAAEAIVQPTGETITDGSAIAPESSAEPEAFSFSPTLPIEPTVALTATFTPDPALGAVTLPETTQDPLPLDTGGTQVADVGTPVTDAGLPTVDPGLVPTTDPAVVDPSVVVTDPAVVDPSVTSESRATIPDQQILDRGQVLDGIARRDLIQPYGVHSWTFSGYRGENITLELTNITGRGNPSLELRDEGGASIASDIDTVNTSNVDSLIQLQLPEDGIYTVIVRMAAVDEQLYSLTLTRQ
jgi:hypothetical protein